MILSKVRDPRLVTIRRGGTLELVLDDQRLRNDICWSVFDCA
jgi:hypothetical protein